MQAIWDEKNIMISITNDLLSLRKEVLQGSIESHVPLACAPGATVHIAVTQAVEELQASKDRFEDASIHLIDGHKHEYWLFWQLKDFGGICRNNCVGNLIWGYDRESHIQSIQS